jgi:zinc protease
MRLIGRSRAYGGLASLILTMLAGAQGAERVPAQQPRPWLADIAVETYTLSNGLKVVLHEDHKAPLVAVHIVYDVGSKDDPPGRTGLAHLLEHLMFEGSKHSDKSYTSSIYRYLTDERGTTDHDLTNYYQTLTPNALERVLWLEADRMGYLPPALTTAKVDNARKVVINERWETLDELPYGAVEESILREIYPLGHPYRHAIIGSIDDLQAIRLPALKDFYRAFYAPNNAALCVAGDFDSEPTKKWISKYFGSIRPGNPPPPVVPKSVELTGPVRIALTDRVSHAFAELCYPTVPANHPDEPALDVLAMVLGTSARWGRLYQSLDHDKQIATYAVASHPTYRLAGKFRVQLFARRGANPAELIALADAEIERLKRDGPTPDEVRKVKIERRRLESAELDSVTSKASLLCRNALQLGDPLAYRTILARVFAVTPDDVKRVARTYLGKGRIEVIVTPGPRETTSWAMGDTPPESDLPRVERASPRKDSFDRSIMPDVGASPVFVAPRVVRRRLSSGVDVRIVARHDLPAVKLKLVVRSGASSVPPGKDGLALMTVNLLEEGTVSRTARQLEDEVIELGATIGTWCLKEASELSVTSVTRNLDRALDLFADAILNPAFSDENYLRGKVRILNELEDRADNPTQIAEDLMPRLIYPPYHPYARTARGTRETVMSITREDIVEFYKRHYVPGNAAIVVVGDVEVDLIVMALEARFGKWPARAVPPAPASWSVPLPRAVAPLYLVDRPGAAQSVVSIGRVGVGIRSADRPTLTILRDTLAGRIATNLRDEKGKTYGIAINIDFHESPGPFTLTGSVPRAETRAAISEIFREMQELGVSTLVSDDDVSEIRDAKLPDWIDRFETIADVSARVAYLVSHRLPDDYYSAELMRFGAVTSYDVNKIAPTFLVPGRMTVLVIGDRARIEKSLRSVAGGRPIQVVDPHGISSRQQREAKPRPLVRAGS